MVILFFSFRNSFFSPTHICQFSILLVHFPSCFSQFLIRLNWRPIFPIRTKFSVSIRVYFFSHNSYFVVDFFCYCCYCCCYCHLFGFSFNLQTVYSPASLSLANFDISIVLITTFWQPQNMKTKLYLKYLLSFWQCTMLSTKCKKK